jgi:uncharacterized protein with PQ loop repeat
MLVRPDGLLRQGQHNGALSEQESGCAQSCVRVPVLNDRVCSIRNGASEALGVVSMLAWAVSEAPQIWQIITTRGRAASGVSIGFVLCWLTGDVFNLVGASISSSTIPAQIGVAVVYFFATAILALQVLYFRYIRPPPPLPSEPSGTDVEAPLIDASTADSSAIHDSSLDVPSPSRRHQHQSSSDRAGNIVFASSPRSLDFTRTSAASTGSPCFALCLLVTLHRPSPSLSKDAIGAILGWIMAVVYLLGRLPQLVHNARSGVQGLSASMFALAVVGNGSYLGAILVKSVRWHDIHPNLPWIVDAVLCLLMDMIILAQYAIISKSSVSSQSYR